MSRIFVYHHNDADGRAAAAIVAHTLEPTLPAGAIEFHEVDYKDSPTFENIVAADRVFIVDFSFKPDTMERLQERTNNIVWCDHHKTAEQYGYAVDGVRDFTEKGRAGCEVTWNYFFPEPLFPQWLSLLGDYDAWRMQQKPDCLTFYEGLKLYPQCPEDYDSVFRRLLRKEESVDNILTAGRCAITYRDNFCQEMRDSFGYETDIGGYHAYACNIYRFGSPGFGEKFREFPICIAYAFDGDKFTVSLYSESVDVGEIAKQNGGGGHKGAAGFICRELPFSARSKL